MATEEKTEDNDNDVVNLKVSKTSELKVKKLQIGSDFKSWSGQVELHFRGLNLWEHALKGSEPPAIENYTREQVVNRCKKDIIMALELQLIKKVLHLENAHQIYQKLFKMFIGTKEGGLRELSEKNTDSTIVETPSVT